ncbi:efflux RND transporter periplasmic adaptor subunit [Rhodoferax sp.]|uniref:efflux RND transporter periplasmic adaptor subunit n=1 Tax=Rhodoferax sp. TaxID=50421 RepID=UPI00374DD96E
MKTAHVFLNLACSVAAIGLWGCSQKPETAAAAAPASAAASPAGAASGAGAPVTVTTFKALQRDLPVLLKATGTVTALTSVDVKSQVTSVIAKVHIEEGQFVKAGQLLFTLDSRTDEANVAKAKAQLAKDTASLADAQRQLARNKELLAQNFISQGALDTARTGVDALVATLAADQAAIDAAKVALSFDRITAPNAGRAGLVPVSAGSVVQANVTTLVTITQLDPMGVAFSLPQRNLGDALSALKGGGAAVTATLADGGGAFKGRLQFVDNLVDASSGSVKAKAVFDNKENKLWPGAFVEVSQTVSIIKDAVVVPQAALIQGARGTVVYTLEDGKAVSKPVQLLYSQGLDAAVSGIQAGDLVVVDGKQNVRPGVRLVERAAEPKKAASAAAGVPAADASKPAAP